MNRNSNFGTAVAHAIFSATVIMCCSSVVSGCHSSEQRSYNPAVATSKSQPSPTIADTTTSPAAALRDLRTIGDKAAAAVLAKDRNTLLSYVIAENRLQYEPALYEPALKDTKSDPYAFIFGPSESSDSKSRSVYEILSTAHQLEIRASVTNSPVDGRQYGLLLFYDKPQVSEKQLKSEEFLCSDEALKKIASWHFELVDSKWTARTLFDQDTDGLCSE